MRRTGQNERTPDLTRGVFEPAVFLAIRRAYEHVLRLIIRPPRASYTMDMLGPRKFRFGKGFVTRDDFSVVNSRGLRVVVSLWRPALEESRYAFSGTYGAALDDAWTGLVGPTAPHLMSTPTIVYLHGNASCRVEGLSILTLCLGLGCAVAACDCAGSGKSDGDYVSLGYYEADDALAVVEYLKASYGLSRYALWGRSMGAVTSLLYASEKAPDTAAVIADSPFASVSRLCRDLVRKAAPKVPAGALTLAVRKVRRSVKYRTQFDIYKCNPELNVKSCKAPGLLVHGADDDFILPSHSDDIASSFGGDCVVLHPPGNHNAKRSFGVFEQIEAFLARHLCNFGPRDDVQSPTILDLDHSKNSGIPNPYFIPPWFFHSKPNGRVELDMRLFQEYQTVTARRKPRAGADKATNEAVDTEFVSGMSEERQKQTEGAINTLFGGRN